MAPFTLIAALALAAAAPPSALDEPVATPRAAGGTFDPTTKVEGATLQVIRGQRALFRLDDRGQPVLAKVEDGQLADAHPAGSVTEGFKGAPAGQIAIALDGSAEKRASALKVWNSTAQPLEFSVVALVLEKGRLVAIAAPSCAVAAGAVGVQSWPRPVVAVGISKFRRAAATAKACG